MSRKTVAVLYDVWWPEELPDPPSSRLVRGPVDETLAEGPDVHEQVFEALRTLGYRPIYAVLEGERESLTKLARVPASIFFNLTESYAGDDTKDFHVAAYLELLGKRYTGSDPRALHLGQDKALAKKLLKFHGVPTPDFRVVPMGSPKEERLNGSLPFPLIVKPPREDGSIGIDSGSVVRDDEELGERVRYVHRTFGCEALVERYVEGREVYVAIVGNDPPEALPLVELDLSRLPEGVPRIAGTEIKWWKGTEIYRETPPVFPRGLSKTLTRKIQKTAIAAYRALGLRDYGRVDLRVTARGDVYVLEVNPNPWLSADCEFFMAWEKSGRDYLGLVERIVDLALERRPS